MDCESKSFRLLAGYKKKEKRWKMEKGAAEGSALSSMIYIVAPGRVGEDNEGLADLFIVV